MMKRDIDFRKKWRLLVIVIFVLLLLGTASIIIYVNNSNSKERIVTGSLDESKVSVSIDAGEPKGERWNSTIQFSDNPSDTKLFVGETVNCSVSNDNDFEIKNWSLQINPATECYLNGFWGGTVEVHQFRNGTEIIEIIPEIVAASEIKNLDINKHMNAMMVRLIPGDYIVFAPNAAVGTDIIRAKDSAGIVFNFYYASRLDFSNYQLRYNDNLKIKDMWQYKVMVFVWTIFIAGLMFFHSVLLVNKRVMRDAKSSDSNISAMADLYLETYRINLADKKAVMLRSKSEQPMLILEDAKIQDCLYKYVDEDCVEIYAEDLKKFFDLSTLEERMKDFHSIVFEYKSKQIGWCSLRFFKLTERKDGEQYILAFQDINEERYKLLEYEEHIRQSENSTLLQGNFLDTIFYALNGMVTGIRKDLSSLEGGLDNDSQKELSNEISNNIEHLLLLGNFVHDLIAIQTERFQLNIETYDIKEMVKMIEGMLIPFKKEKDFELILDIDDKIPSKLRGDRKRLMQILIVLLSSSAMMTEKGNVKLSIYGKQTNDLEELLFSVRDESKGFSDAQLNEIRELIFDSSANHMGDAAYMYFYIMNQILLRMNSELKIVSVLGSGSEFYFTVEQEIATD